MNLSSSSLRSLARLSLPLATAFGLLAGSAALAGPALASAAGPAAFTWHTFKLINGWQSASSPQLVTGTPAWALHDGVIYLKGAVKNPAQTGEEGIATLPAYARPARNLYIADYDQAATAGALEISTSGSIDVFGSNSENFASLGNISYPLGSITPHKLTLKNGWASENADYSSGNPAYSISGGIVYLSGSMAHGKPGWAAAVLPKAARPAHVMYVLVYTFGGDSGLITIYPNGKIIASGADATSYTSLANISYPVASTKWHAFTLIDNWKSADPTYHTGAPSYVVINGVVYVGGAMTGTKAPNGFWTPIPTAVQPPAQVFAEVDMGGAPGEVDFAESDGLASSASFSNAKKFTSLASIAYPLSA